MGHENGGWMNEDQRASEEARQRRFTAAMERLDAEVAAHETPEPDFSPWDGIMPTQPSDQPPRAAKDALGELLDKHDAESWALGGPDRWGRYSPSQEPEHEPAAERRERQSARHEDPDGRVEGVDRG